MAELIYRTLRENIADIIRKRIIYQELEPGQKIVEQDLAKEFKTSRAPIREALRQLENEELIEYVRNAGCSVKEITLEESFEIYAGELRNHGSEADGRKRSGGYHLPDGRSAGKNEKTG